MIVTTINPEGNFDCWSPDTLAEVEKGQISSDIGLPLFENKDFKFWQIKLAPKQRLPFRKHNTTYSCNCLTDGLLISRNTNGEILLLRFDRGDFIFREFEEEGVHDLENIGENEVLIAVVEERLKTSQIPVEHNF